MSLLRATLYLIVGFVDLFCCDELGTSLQILYIRTKPKWHICLRASSLHYCTQCDQVFCDDCKVSHLRLKLCKYHHVITKPNFTMEKKARECTDHNEDFIFLCQHCNQLICRSCVTTTHIQHTLRDIKEIEKLCGNLTFQ